MRFGSNRDRIATRVGRALRGALRLLSRQESGIAAVEFSLILPIMVVLWIGGVEITQALSVDRRLNNLASSIGDLVSRTKKVGFTMVDQIFDIAPGAMYPYCKDATECSTKGLQMRVSGVKISTAGAATIAWSRGKGIAALALNTNMNSVVPASLRPASAQEAQIIMTEVYYIYRPAVGYMITGNLNLNDRMFFVPRLVSKIPLCQSVNPDTNCQS